MSKTSNNNDDDIHPPSSSSEYGTGNVVPGLDGLFELSYLQLDENQIRCKKKIKNENENPGVKCSSYIINSC